MAVVNEPGTPLLLRGVLWETYVALRDAPGKRISRAGVALGGASTA